MVASLTEAAALAAGAVAGAAVGAVGGAGVAGAAGVGAGWGCCGLSQPTVAAIVAKARTRIVCFTGFPFEQAIAKGDLVIRIYESHGIAIAIG